MAKTRTRGKQQPETTTEETFDPAAVAGKTEVEEQFYDSQAGHPEDADGDIEPDQAYASGEGDGAGENKSDETVSAGPLGSTVAGMSQGTQAAAAELKDYIRRMSNLAEEKQAILDDIKELKKEIKGKGYDTKAFDLVMKLSGMSESEARARREQNLVNATYAHAVGIDEDLL